jgi:predicted Zn-dependent peptidase
MPIGGDDATIKRTKRGDILNIYQNYYNPGNMILSIYGGVETRKALSIIKEHFADFHKKSKTPSRTDATESQVRKEITINKKGIKQTRLGIGFKSMGFRSVGIKEYLSMEVISEILSKRMFDEVREKRGLSYDPGASYSIYNTFGFIAAAAGIEPAKQDETKEVMLKEFEKMQNGEVDKSELSKRKQGLSVRYAIDKEDTLGMALSISDAHLTYGDTSIPERIPGLIKTVSLDDVRKYSSEYINVDKYGLVVLKPKK